MYETKAIDIGMTQYSDPRKGFLLALASKYLFKRREKNGIPHVTHAIKRNKRYRPRLGSPQYTITIASRLTQLRQLRQRHTSESQLRGENDVFRTSSVTKG